MQLLTMNDILGLNPYSSGRWSKTNKEIKIDLFDLMS